MRRTGLFTAAFFIAGLILGSGGMAGEYTKGAKGDLSQASNQQISSGDDLQQFSVQDLQGEKIGQIDEVIVDLQQGRIGYVVTSSQEGQKHVIPWQALQANPQQQTLTLQVSADQLRQAPRGDAQVVSDADQARQINQFFGVAPVWGTGMVQPEQVRGLQELQQFAVRDAQGQKLGQIDQVLVDVQRGQIGYVVITSQQQPGQKHVIPWNALQANMQQQTLTLPISAQRFQQAPTGDAQIVRDLNQARQIHQFYGVPAYFETGYLPAQAGQQQFAQQTYQQFPQLQVKSVDTLKQYTLHDLQGQRLGPISQILVDVQRGQIGYVVVTSQQGQQHLIPWNALRIDPQQQTLAVQMSASQLQQLPLLDERMVQDVNQARQIHQFFGVAPYWEAQQPMQQQMHDQMKQMHQQRQMSQ